MHILNNHFPHGNVPAPNLSIVPGASKYQERGQNRDEGQYRVVRDYPVGVDADLDYSEVVEKARNAANYDAAAALDLN